MNKDPKRPIVFLGSTRFSAEVLNHILENGFIVGLVISVPNEASVVYDKNNLTVSDVCRKFNIKHIKPEKISEAREDILAIKPSILLTCAYGKFLPENILDIPKNGSWNVHASLLPKLRGGAPIQWAIINNFSETGITFMRMAPKMDAGTMIGVSKVAITPGETYGSLYLKLIRTSKPLVVSCLKKVAEGHFAETEQDESQVTFGFVIKKPQAIIDWNKSNVDIDCFVRGLNPDPIAYTYHSDMLYKVFAGAKYDNETHARPGLIVKIDKTGIYVSTGDGTYKITDIQREGKKHLKINEFINGERKLVVGSHFNLIS